MSETLLTSTQVAQMLGVTPASVKRWSDAGLLPCVKTAGGHRRFRKEEVERFRPTLAQTAHEECSRYVDTWMQLILTASDSHELIGALVRERAKCGSWWQVSDDLGAVLYEVGVRWANGQITILEEHLASERLQRAVARCAEMIPTHPDMPRCLLATAEGDEHTLGLSLAELCFREAGYYTLWAGRKTPTSDLIDYITQQNLSVMAISASSLSEEDTLSRQAYRIAAACEKANVSLLFGGSGRWPSPPPYGHRMKSFAQLHEWAQSH